MSRAGFLLGRGLRLIASGALVAWSCFILQAYGGTGTLSAAASRIMGGEVLRPATLAEITPLLGPVETAALPPPDLLRAAAIVRVRQAEDEVSAGHAIAANPAFAVADTALRAALAVTPTDAFLWFALAWLGKTRDGFAPAQLADLAASYRTGPREGWIALHRNALAVTLLPALPPPLRADTLAEFRNLVASNYLPAAADILAGPGWAQRDTLLATLAPLPDDTRAAFAQQLTWKGVDADVPGILHRRDRPWR